MYFIFDYFRNILTCVCVSGCDMERLGQCDEGRFLPRLHPGGGGPGATAGLWGPGGGRGSQVCRQYPQGRALFLDTF